MLRDNTQRLAVTAWRHSEVLTRMGRNPPPATYNIEEVCVLLPLSRCVRLFLQASPTASAVCFPKWRPREDVRQRCPSCISAWSVFAV